MSWLALTNEAEHETYFIYRCRCSRSGVMPCDYCMGEFPCRGGCGQIDAECECEDDND